VTSTSTVTGLDPATGQIAWSTMLPGSLTSGTAIAPDGSIAVVANVATTTSMIPTLYVLEPGGAVRHTFPLETLDLFSAGPGSTLYAIGLDGTALVGTVSNGASKLVAVSSAGQMIWKTSASESEAVQSATIDASGTVVVTEATAIVGLDPTTGATKWKVDLPPESIACGKANAGIASATLTSAGGIVAIGQCAADFPGITTYTLFGASD
jgi:outer membrane protein assembly factor BamB